MSTEGGPRLALLGAFAYPVPQGSQVYAGEQARALAAAGADVRLFVYGRGEGPAPDGLRVERTPAWSAPASAAAGPRARKPLADAALLALWLRAARRRRYDAVLAHNAEAACVALAARPWCGVPVIYVAHTRLETELPRYARLARGVWRRAGARLDRGLAARADAVLALTRGAAEALDPPHGAIDVIPPGLALRPEPPREAALALRRRLPAQPLVLYAGNLDAYQDLEVLSEAAARLEGVTLLAATHQPPRDLGALRVWPLRDDAELRALTAVADLCVLPRRTHGGFPIKLLNYMEAARPIVARAGLVDGLVHGRDAWLVPEAADGEAFAAAIRGLLAEPERAAALGRAARATLEREHAWPGLAARTLALVGRCAAGRRQERSRTSSPVVETRTS